MPNHISVLTGIGVKSQFLAGMLWGPLVGVSLGGSNHFGGRRRRQAINNTSVNYMYFFFVYKHPAKDPQKTNTNDKACPKIAKSLMTSLWGSLS
eukprot:1070033-Amphidinium_carterae.1